MAETSRIATSPRWGVLSGLHPMIYALMDGSPRINELHVEAAIAVWDYCSESARLIFGDRTGHADVDKLIDAIEAVGRQRPNRTEQTGLFKNAKRKAGQARIVVGTGVV
jgi:hypothetical protein